MHPLCSLPEPGTTVVRPIRGRPGGVLVLDFRCTRKWLFDDRVYPFLVISVKIKLELPHFHVLCIRYMSCFDSTHAPVATAALAAATGLVSVSTRPDIPSMLHLEREARDWSTYNEYSYRIILLLLLHVYCSGAHPRFPSQFRRHRLQDFFYL